MMPCPGKNRTCGGACPPVGLLSVSTLSTCPGPEVAVDLLSATVVHVAVRTVGLSPCPPCPPVRALISGSAAVRRSGGHRVHAVHPSGSWCPVARLSAGRVVHVSTLSTCPGCGVAVDQPSVLVRALALWERLPLRRGAGSGAVPRARPEVARLYRSGARVCRGGGVSPVGLGRLDHAGAGRQGWRSHRVATP